MKLIEENDFRKPISRQIWVGLKLPNGYYRYEKEFDTLESAEKEMIALNKSSGGDYVVLHETFEHDCLILQNVYIEDK